jgi:hypothetical protein
MIKFEVMRIAEMRAALPAFLFAVAEFDACLLQSWTQFPGCTRFFQAPPFQLCCAAKAQAFASPGRELLEGK